MPRAWIVCCIVYAVAAIATATHTFDCYGYRACFEDTLFCPDGEDCLVECDGYFSCKKATVQCAAGSNCEINCTGDEACKELTVYAESASSLTVNCHTADQQSCNAADFYCAVDANSDDITCHINGITDQNARHTQIFAVDGFEDVEITGDISSSSPEVTVACGSDYSTRCDISSATFKCDACSDLQLTSTPTQAPTMTPTTTTSRTTAAPSPAPESIHENIAMHSEEADDLISTTIKTISSSTTSPTR